MVASRVTHLSLHIRWRVPTRAGEFTHIRVSSSGLREADHASNRVYVLDKPRWFLVHVKIDPLIRYTRFLKGKANL